MRSRRSPSQMTAAASPIKNNRPEQNNQQNSYKPVDLSGNVIGIQVSKEQQEQKLPKVTEKQQVNPLPSEVASDQQIQFRGNTYFSCAELRELEVLSKLGEGAFSSVYRVRRLKDGKEYALKRIKMGELTPKERDNAITEVQFLASIHSNHVVAYKQAIYDEQRGQLCVLMEFAEGGDLSRVIKRAQNLEKYVDEQTVWLYTSHIAKGLKALHDLKVLHRDLKAANVLLDKSRTRALLGDLNVSKKLKPDGLLYTQTGTPYYASPEVWSDKPYNAKSDIWSFGCLIYELCTRKPPFTAPDMEQLSKKIIKGNYEPIPNVYSKELSELIGNMMKVQPEGRPSCSEILKIIRLQQAKMNNNNSLLNSFYESPRRQDQYRNEQQLLSTIRVGKNLQGLTEKLPAPQYDYTPLLAQSDELSKNGSQCSSSIKQQSQCFSAVSGQIQEIRGRTTHRRNNSDNMCLHSSIKCESNNNNSSLKSDKDNSNNNYSSKQQVHSCEQESRSQQQYLKQKSIQLILQKQQILLDQHNLNHNKEIQINKDTKPKVDLIVHNLKEQNRKISSVHELQIKNINRKEQSNASPGENHNSSDANILIGQGFNNIHNKNFSERIAKSKNPCIIIDKHSSRDNYQGDNNMSQIQIPKRLFIKQNIKKIPDFHQISQDYQRANPKQKQQFNHQSSQPLQSQIQAIQKYPQRDREVLQIQDQEEAQGSLKNRCCSVDYKKAFFPANNGFMKHRGYSQPKVNEESKNVNNNGSLVQKHSNKNLDIISRIQSSKITQNERNNYISQEDLQATRKRQEIQNKQIFMSKQQPQSQGYLMIQSSVKPSLVESPQKGSSYLFQQELFRQPLNFNYPGDQSSGVKSQDTDILQRLLDAKIRKKDPRNKSMHFSSEKPCDQIPEIVLPSWDSSQQHHTNLIESPLGSIDEHNDLKQQRISALVSLGKAISQREAQLTNTNHQTLPRIFLNKLKPRRQSVKYTNGLDDQQFISKHPTESTNDSTPGINQIVSSSNSSQEEEEHQINIQLQTSNINNKKAQKQKNQIKYQFN